MTALNLPTRSPSTAINPRAIHPTRQAVSSATAPKLRYIVVTLIGIFGILGVQLMLSIAVSGGAYEIAGLKSEVRNSQQELQVVAEDINALVAPDTLATLAASMGMVADNNPAYLRLSDSAVLGQAVPASHDSATLVYSVTAGTETFVTPEIVQTVQQSVLGQMAVVPEVADPLATAEQPVTAVVTPASTPVVGSTQPAPRFGGSLPSPSTR